MFKHFYLHFTSRSTKAGSLKPKEFSAVFSYVSGNSRIRDEGVARLPVRGNGIREARFPVRGNGIREARFPVRGKGIRA